MSVQLNEQQKKAAFELEKNILLLAPAGTGKTNTLAVRIANILQKKLALPEEILCLTFTNKACKEMQERILGQVGAAAQKVRVKTFHGFCYDIIKAEAKENSDLFADFTIVDEEDAKGILLDLTDGVWPEKVLPYLVEQLKAKRAEYGFLSDNAQADYQKTLERLLKEDKTSVEQKCINEKFRFMPEIFAKWQTEGPQLVTAYDNRLQELHGLDFTDLITHAGAILQDEATAQKWASRFRYIHIDEVQDTSRFEYRVMKKIFGTSRLLLAGDYFQTIYEWRGSEPEEILAAYARDYQPERIQLQENYRSTECLLNASFAVLKHFFPHKVEKFYPAGMQAVSQEKGARIQLKGAEDMKEEAEWIHQTIRHLPVTDYSRVCVLTRNNKYNHNLSKFFQGLGRYLPSQKRLPFMLLDEAKFFRRQEIKDALAFLKLLSNKHDAQSLVRILQRFAKGIGPATIKKLTSPEYRKAGIQLTDFIDRDACRFGDPYQILLKELELENVVVFDVESTGVDPTSDEIIQIAAVRLRKDGTVKGKFNRLLRATKSVGTSELVHHISDEKLQKEGQEPAQVLREFCAFAQGSVIVGHNVTYDLTILHHELMTLGLPQLDYVIYYDTLDIFRRFYPNLPNHKLEYLGEFCRVHHKSSHDAFDDIMATAEILLFAIRQNILPSQLDRRAKMGPYWQKFASLAELLADLQEKAKTERPYQLLGDVVVRAKIAAYYEAKNESARVENLRDLYRKAKELDVPQLDAEGALAKFLEYTALSSTELDALTKAKPHIPIITVHQAKGSEFDYVFVAGLQEGTFPMPQTIREGRLDEEQRLFYVAITRAKKQLFLSYCTHFGKSAKHKSRFLDAIPRQYIENA